MLALLSIAGFCYGSIIAIYPVAISDEFGDSGPKAYGRVFTAWGFSGLVAPWSAGLIFDVYGDYRVALIVAGMLALLSAVTVHLGGVPSARRISS